MFVEFINQFSPFWKYPKSHHFWGIQQKPFNFTYSLGTPGSFPLDHHSSYHYGHPAQPACTFHRKNPIDPARHPQPEQPQQPVKRPPRLVKIFFLFSQEDTIKRHCRTPSPSISPPVIILWWIFSSELILFFPFLTRFVVKQKNNNST